MFQAVIAERIRGVVDEGRTLLAEADPADAMFMFLRSMVLQWGAADRGLVDALAGSGIDVNTVVPEAEDEYLSVLGDLLSAGQKAGTVRRDVTVSDVKALLVGCQAMQAYNDDVAERVTSVVFDGLRAKGRR